MADDFVARKDIEKWLRTEMASLDTEEDREFVIERLREEIPSADVVPVVRCKECQNSYEWANVYGDNYRYCGYLRDRWNCDYDRMVDDDDFCKWGRKMDKEDTNAKTTD